MVQSARNRVRQSGKDRGHFLIMFISRRWGWGEMTNLIIKKFNLAVVDRIHFMGRCYLELLAEWPCQWAKRG